MPSLRLPSILTLDFLLSKWPRLERRNLTFPVAVKLKRLAAAFFVFNFIERKNLLRFSHLGKQHFSYGFERKSHEVAVRVTPNRRGDQPKRPQPKHEGQNSLIQQLGPKTGQSA